MPELNTEIAYFNTRIAGMRSALFPQSAVEEMLEGGKLRNMTDVLLESAYRKEMAEALSRYGGADAVEDAVSRNLTETYQALLSRASGEFRELVAFFLTRWDLNAAKSLLRLRHHGIVPDEHGLTLVPGPTLTAARLRELAQIDSVEQLVGALASWNPALCRELRRALPAYRERSDLAVLEEALDRAYFVAGLDRWKASEDANAVTLCEQLRAELDRINLRLAFQAASGAIDGDEFAARLLPGGTLGADLLRKMAAAGDIAGAVAQLEHTRYRALVEELFKVAQTGRFSGMERFLDRLLMKQMRRFARRDVFGIGVLMDYVWLKYNECINLRLIARGLAGGLPVGRVREELYFV